MRHGRWQGVAHAPMNSMGSPVTMSKSPSTMKQPWQGFLMTCFLPLELPFEESCAVWSPDDEGVLAVVVGTGVTGAGPAVPGPALWRVFAFEFTFRRITLNSGFSS